MKIKLLKKTKLFLTALSLFLLVSGTAFAAPKVSQQRQTLITTSLGYLGVPYVYGATDYATQKGFDCSGYVMYVFKKALNMNLPRTAQQMYDYCEIITSKEREPGDLVFFKNDPKGKVTHVGIYLGVYHGNNPKFEGKRVFVSAVSDGPNTGVVISLMDAHFWKTHYFATGRLLPPSKSSGSSK